MRRLVLTALLLLCPVAAFAAEPPKAPDIGQICDMIARAADRNGLPRAFFARLIW
jgi:hypothetical protein